MEYIPGVGEWLRHHLSRGGVSNVQAPIEEQAAIEAAVPEVASPLPIVDPHWPAVIKGISELYQAITLREVPYSDDSISVHLLPTDLSLSRTITRLLPVKSISGFRVDIGIEVDSASFSVYADRDTEPSPVRRNSGLLVEVKQPDRWDDSIMDVHFKRTYHEPNDRYSSREDLSGRTDVRPEAVLRDMKKVIGSLRGEFALAEATRAEALLNPRQRGLVDAIRDIGMEQRHFTRDEEYPDEFLLKAFLGKEGRLDELELAFSASPKVDNLAARRNWARQLDNLTVKWENRGNSVEGITHAFFVSTKDSQVSILAKPKQLAEDGEISIERKSRRSTILLDRLPVYIVRAIDHEGECSLGGVLGRSFYSFLEKRAGRPSTYGSNLLLATSVPLTA